MILSPYTSQSLAVHSDGADLTLDATGRWRTFRTVRGVFRNSLTGEVVHSTKSQVTVLSDRQRELLQVDLVRELNRLMELAENGSVPLEETSIKDPGKLLLALKNGLSWLNLHESNSAERFTAVYPEAITMLPPDRYKDIVILPATGCPHSECTFCSLYDDAGFKPLSQHQFDRHIEGVKQLFGDALEERTGIFLGSASALSLGQRRLTAVLEKLIENFGLLKRGVAAFYDPYHAPKRNESDYAELEALGFRQATIGLESGLPEMRGLWGKSPELSPFFKAIEQLKLAGIQVAVTVLTGFDNGNLHQRHVEATLDVVDSLPLEKSDIVYLSPYFPARLPDHQADNLLRDFKHELKNRTIAKVVSYHVERFHYFV